MTPPAEFGLVICDHAGGGPDSNCVLFELIGQPVTPSLYNIMFTQRAKLLRRVLDFLKQTIPEWIEILIPMA